jgi:hypothetical protein
VQVSYPVSSLQVLNDLATLNLLSGYSLWNRDKNIAIRASLYAVSKNIAYYDKN